MKKIFVLLAAIVSLSSCEKFLEIKPISEKPEDGVLNTYQNVEKLMYSTYDKIQSGNVFGGQLVRINELYGDNIDFFNTNITNNVNGREYAFRSRSFNIFDNPAAGIWADGYAAIYYSNLIINAVDQNYFTATTAQKNKLKGEALFIRAIMHFEICRVFGFPYSAGGNDKGTVLRTRILAANETQIKVQRSSVAEVYTQVIADLKAASNLLPDNNDPNRANKSAAEAYLARVYFDMNDFANAQTHANNVINGGKFSLPAPSDSSVVEPFRNSGASGKKGGVIFQMLNLTNDDQSGTIRGFWQRFPNNVSMAYRADNGLIADMQAIGGRRYEYMVVNKDVLPYGSKWKSSPNGNLPVNVPVIRMAELFLIRAECKARLNPSDEASIREDYNVLRRIAFAPEDNTTTGQQALLDAIETERRVEFVCEGHRYHDLRRLRKNISNGVEIFAYNTDQLVPIPQAEINGNPNLE
jgi:hypothetical protein